MVFDTVGEQDLRAENIDKVVKGFALENYKLKKICMTQSSNSWKESYYAESAAELSGSASWEGNMKYVSRLANFPYLEPSWEKSSAYQQKHAAEGVVSWEDAKTNEIDVVARTLLRISRAIALSVDRRIYAAITDSTITTNTAAASANWDDPTIANRDPIYDLLVGIEYITRDNYDILANGFLLLNPEDYTNILRNSKVINNPSFKTADVVSNGVVGSICGLKIIVSHAVDDDEAAIVVGQVAVTWKSAAGLQTNTTYDPGIKYTIRAWEVGVPMVVNPLAIHIITNTHT